MLAEHSSVQPWRIRCAVSSSLVAAEELLAVSLVISGSQGGGSFENIGCGIFGGSICGRVSDCSTIGSGCIVGHIHQ